jgi:hypothetical protein
MFNVWAHMTVMYKMRQSAKINMRMTRQIMQRPAAQLAATIRRCAQDWIDFGRRFATQIPSSVAEVWFRAVAGAFLISICFLVSFIAADAWMSRRPTSLQSICSNVLELYRSRDQITDNGNGSKNLVACTMTARSRSTNPN